MQPFTKSLGRVHEVDLRGFFGLPGIVRGDRMGPPCTSHEVRPFWKGSHNPRYGTYILTMVINHLITKWDDPPSSGT